MGSRKCVHFCSIIITLMILSSNMNAKLYNYSRPVSKYSINRSDGLPGLQKNSGHSRKDNSSSSLFRLSSLVRKYFSSQPYALLSGILASVLQSYSHSSPKFLFESTSQHLQNHSTNGLARNISNIGLLYPALNVFIPSSGTSSLYDINTTLNATKSINWRSKLEVEDGTNSEKQQLFKPPTVINKAQSNGSHGTCPVYSGKNVPPYVYQYRLSGSKYRQLLAGLALYNLGAISTNQSMYKYHKHYIPQPDDICKFGVRYENGTNDEMAIDCRAITHFILTEQSKPHSDQAMKPPQTSRIDLENSLSTKGDTHKYKNVVLNSERNVQNQIMYSSYYSNQIVPKVSGKDKLQQKTGKKGDGVGLGHVMTGVVNATDPIFYGKPVNVTSKMECYVVGSMRSMNMKKAVPCHVLEKYTVRSINSNSAIMIKSLIMVALRFLFCYK